MLCWHALLRAALLASAVLRADSRPALRGGHGPRTGCCHRNNSTDYACMCMCNAMNTSLGRYVDKHFVKEWAHARAADVPYAETVAYVDATTISTFFDASLIANAGRQLIFKSTHLCGGVMAVTLDAVTCLRQPCYTADPVATRVHKSRRAGFFVGRLATGSINATMAVLRRTCSGWLDVRYRGVMGIEGGLYRGVHRGCMLETAIHTDAAHVTDIKVFCFAGRCAFAMVSSKRFASSANASAGAVMQKTDTRGFFTTPGWKRLRTVQIKENHPYLASWTAPPFAARLLAHAEALAQGFGNVRVDFLYSDEKRYYFNEVTFAHSGCVGGSFAPPGLERLYGHLEVNDFVGSAEAVEARQLQIVAEYERDHVFTCPCWRRASHCCWRARGSRRAIALKTRA